MASRPILLLFRNLIILPVPNTPTVLSRNSKPSSPAISKLLRQETNLRLRAYALVCAFRHAAGGIPTIRLNARENAASES